MRITIRNGFRDGAALRQKREAAGYSQEGLAGKAGIGVRTVIRLEQATQKAPVDVVLSSLEAVGRVLGLEYIVSPEAQNSGEGSIHG